MKQLGFVGMHGRRSWSHWRYRHRTMSAQHSSVSSPRASMSQPGEVAIWVPIAVSRGGVMADGETLSRR